MILAQIFYVYGQLTIISNTANDLFGKVGFIDFLIITERYRLVFRKNTPKPKFRSRCSTETKKMELNVPE